MGDTYQIRGVVAHIKWSWYQAAALHGYTIVVNKKTRQGTLVGTVVVSDAFKMAQRPLELVVLMQPKDKRWAIASHEFNKATGTIRAILSPIKESLYESAHPEAGDGQDRHLAR
jgi:hypothetical protein